MVPDHVKQSICDAARRLVAARLVVNTQGNISVRAGDHIAVTPHDLDYDVMGVQDICTVDLAGRRVEGEREPSVETAVHLAVYRARPDVGAVVHTEPVNANAFGVVGRPIDPVLVNLALFNGGPVPVMDYLPSGSADFGAEMLRVLGEGNAVIWANHGLLACAPTLNGAVRGSVAVETAAETLIKALQLGVPRVPEDYRPIG